MLKVANPSEILEKDTQTYQRQKCAADLKITVISVYSWF